MENARGGSEGIAKQIVGHLTGKLKKIIGGRTVVDVGK